MSALLYELWDQASGNCLGVYDDTQTALADVRDSIHRYGQRSIASMALLSNDADTIKRVAAGNDLVALANAVAPVVSYIGVGLYSIREAARIIRATPGDLRRWLHYDPYQSRGKTYRRVPFVVRSLPPEAEAVTLTELMELRAIGELRGRGFPMRRIRAIAAELSDQWNTPFPLSSQRFSQEHQVAGRHLYVRPVGGILRESPSGQLALQEIVGPLLEDIDFSADGSALRFWPLSKQSRVVCDAQRQFGQPIDAPTGVPTRALFMAARANPRAKVASIAHWYDVPEAAVFAALAYERPRAA